MVANTLNSYRLEAEESGRVTDILATTATNASTTVKEIGPAFRQVAPLAREFNIPIEQIAASLGILRTAGLRSEQAGTGLRNIIAILQENPTAEISAAFEEMGLNFEYLKGRLASGDLIGVFNELNAAGLDGASALEIFGRESVIAATSLANAANSGDFDAFIAKINEGAGTADAMREVMESGLPGGVARFMSAIEGLQIALGDAGLTRYISGALQALTDLVRRFEDAPGPVKTVGALLFTLGPILLGLAFATKVVAFAIGGLIPLMRVVTAATWLWNNALLRLRLQILLSNVSVNTLRGSTLLLRVQLFLMAVQTRATAAATWLLNVANTALTLTGIRAATGFVATRIAMLAATVATVAMTVAQWALNVALTANPIGVLIVGIGLLIAALIAVGFAVWKFRDEILAGLGAAWNWVKDNWPLLLAILTGPFGLAVFAIIRYKDEIIAIITGLVDKVKELWEPIGDILGNVTGGAQSVVGTVGNVLGFAEGGIVPGPEGQARAAIVHGGEGIFPAHLMERLSMGPHALAPAFAAPAPAFGGGGRTVTIGDIDITVHVGADADADEIATTIRRELRDQIEDLVADADGPVVR